MLNNNPIDSLSKYANAPSNVYVTKSNSSKIATYSSIKGRAEDFENLYDSSLSFLLSTPELNLLYIYKETVSNPEHIFQAYKKWESVDTKKYVWEGGTPAFHSTYECERLHSQYVNLEIPVEIQSRGDLEVEKFRRFVKANYSLMDDNESLFLKRLEAQFFLRNPPKSVRAVNSGLTTVKNLDLNELKHEIDKLIKSAQAFKGTDQHVFNLIENKGYGTHKVKEAKILGHPLNTWHNYKIDLKESLKQYFLIRFNPELQFDKTLLQQIGFMPCGNCCKK
ncbi:MULTISPECIES: hypothetical protein [unclassified Pseudoalteromonas]|uniref:hypothetical protein n=1 Tax=unclassified Pseudoalteromonas TaxID=194690 RepID=UPI0015FF00BD|nr:MULTISPECIES: hypothetical protein [unclassified Pseudoalteromonas]MBB1351222.1 hypothetical protein [Pseudoalteromonas sp. SG45-3]MBB1358676.1 hypothetical protein [Pseudoalteromonas sp. SG45-6]